MEGEMKIREDQKLEAYWADVNETESNAGPFCM